MPSFRHSVLLPVVLCWMNWTTTASNLPFTVSDKAGLATRPAAPMPVSVLNIKEYGLLKNVEDSGYPFVTLTIEFPERGFTEYFTLNLEEVKSVDAATLSGSVGKYLSFEYTSEIVNALLDLKRNGKSLLGESVELTADTKTITGILSNAAEATTGDEPGVLFIKTEEEITETFPFFITPEIVQANGKTVVGYYEQRTQNTITALTIQ